jgi:transposase, IS5 family
MLMKISNITGLFDEENVLSKLTKLGDPLVLIEKHINFSLFKENILQFTGRLADTEKPVKGRPAYDVVTMMKIIFLQRLYNLSDDQAEFQITDRLSFRRFLAIPLSNAVPDCKTVWAFREALNKEGEDRTKQLFELFLNKLNDEGLLAKEGKMMDATIVSVPIQRNSRDENKEIKEGKTPASFSKNKNKLAQKDTDARWTQKNNINYFGYKNHIKAETKRKFITDYKVTDAAPHDSTVACDLLNESDKGQDFYADSAYQTDAIKDKLKALEMKEHIIEKGHRNHPLTAGQKQTNRKKSKTRCRVEHIFGFMETNMNDGTFIRTIGKARATVIIGLNNLVYNICRYVQLKKLKYA